MKEGERERARSAYALIENSKVSHAAHVTNYTLSRKKIMKFTGLLERF